MNTETFSNDSYKPSRSSSNNLFESVSEQSPKLYRQVATEQGSRVKLCILLSEKAVGGSTGGVSDFTIQVKLQTINNRLSIQADGLQGMPFPQAKKGLAR